MQQVDVKHLLSFYRDSRVRRSLLRGFDAQDEQANSGRDAPHGATEQAAIIHKPDKRSRGRVRDI